MEIFISYRTKKRILKKYQVKNFVLKTIKYLFNKNIIKKLKLNLIFVNNSEIKKLNKKFLHKDRFTDVLCFKYDKYSADIIISVEQVIKQASLFANTNKKELLFIILHGILHFKGMNDDTEIKKKKMLKYAERILKSLNTKLSTLN